MYGGIKNSVEKRIKSKSTNERKKRCSHLKLAENTKNNNKWNSKFNKHYKFL